MPPSRKVHPHACKRALILIFFTFVIADFTLPVANSRSQTTNPHTNTRKETAARPERLRRDVSGTVEGRLHPEDIPDYVAYELFMRSRADQPSAAVFKDFGFSQDELN